jgi:hypothetical protein
MGTTLRFPIRRWPPDLSHDELLVHRRKIDQEHPSLSAKAGTHFLKPYHNFHLAFEHAHGDDVRFRAAVRQLALIVKATSHQPRIGDR